MDGVENELSELAEDDLTEEDQSAAFNRFRVAMTPTQEAAVSLFDFAINPRDFGQTVENLFYISFLVREGNAQIFKDENGLPLLGKFANIYSLGRSLTSYSPCCTTWCVRTTRPRCAETPSRLQYRLPYLANVHPSLRHQRTAHTASRSRGRERRRAVVLILVTSYGLYIVVFAILLSLRFSRLWPCTLGQRLPSAYFSLYDARLSV
jgi:hypothetical protein